MGKEEGNSVLQWCSLVALILLLIGSVTWMSTTLTVDEDAIAEKVASQIDMDMTIPTVTAEVNLTGIEDRLYEIETTINEDNDWEDEALAMAKYEWKDRDYKDIYKAINSLCEFEIDDRDDIEYVRIKDEDVNSFDVDDEDAEVVQEVKVKYEDENGHDQKVYFTIETEIEDGEVEDQEIELTLDE